MHTQAIGDCVFGDHGFILILIAAVRWFVCKVSLQKNIESIYRYKIATGRRYFLSVTSFDHCVATAFVAINSKTSQVDENPSFLMAYIFFYKKIKGIFKAFLNSQTKSFLRTRGSHVSKCREMLQNASQSS